MQRLFTEIKDDNPFQTLFEWSSPERHWVEKDRAWYVSYALFFLLLMAFAALMGEFILVFAILVFAFLWFVQATVPPQIAKHTITSLGVRMFDKFYKWSDIKYFWFSTRNGVHYLNLDLIKNEISDTRTHTLSLIVNFEDVKKIFDIVVLYTDYGQKDQIGYNIISKSLKGEYFDITYFLPEETPTQSDYLQYNTPERQKRTPAKKSEKTKSKKNKS